MSLSSDKKAQIAEVLRSALRKKMSTYQPEPAAMPFHTRLLGKDRIALFSFIHSLNTNFGASIFEPVATVLAEHTFRSVTCQESVGKHITEDAASVVDNIMRELEGGTNRNPDQTAEIAEIRNACRGKRQSVKLTKADIKLVGNDGTLYLIDIKTAKPNREGFKAMKRTLLRWTAATLADDPQAKVHPLIAIPYNPYAPKPYSRWTMKGMMDMNNDVKIADDFWAFISGSADSYDMLLDVFEQVGIELRQEIDDYFKQYAPA